MRFGFFLFSFSLVAPLFLGAQPAVAAGTTLTWKNHCRHALYYWTVGPSETEDDAKYVTVPARSEATHQMVQTYGGGVVLKFRDLPYYTHKPAGIIQAEYNLEPATNTVWYDLSAIDCTHAAGPGNPNYCPFLQGGMRMYVPGMEDKGCRTAVCQPGLSCDGVYLEHGSWYGEPSFACPLGVNVVMETCFAADADRTWENGRPSSPPEGHWGGLPQQIPPSPPELLLPPPAPVELPPSPPLAELPPSPAAPSVIAVAESTTVIGSTSPSPSEAPPLDWSPTAYPIPAGFPTNTVCFDEQCICYGFLREAPSYPVRPLCPDGIIGCYFFNACEGVNWNAVYGDQWELDSG